MDGLKANNLFSSPLWGLFYLIIISSKEKRNKNWFSSPLWGFFYLIFQAVIIHIYYSVLVPSLGILLFNKETEKAMYINFSFSSPLWGFFYLIFMIIFIGCGKKVLVPSLGILLFNYVKSKFYLKERKVLVPSLGILLFNGI